MAKRELYLEKLRQLRDMNVIKVVTGARRCGKSTLLEQFRHELKERGVKDKNIIAFNLEEKENQKYLDDKDLLYETILARREKNVQNYVFIDEVQWIREFEKMIDSLFVKDDLDLYITGSNAYMTSSELATLLSGRYVEIKMQPLTFGEFLQFFPDNVDITAKFQQFMRYGGFPEVANFLVAGSEAQIPLYLQGIYETVLEKDIKMRGKIRGGEDFDNTVAYIYDNIGSITSPNNIANTLGRENKLVNKETVDNYLRVMQECFMLYGAKRFDVRGKTLLKTLQKYYAVDLGLVETILGRASNANLGHRLENVVYLELLQRYGQVWVGKNYDKEIDFVVKNNDGISEYFQVALSVTDDLTLERELAAFANTGDHYRRTLLTLDTLETDEAGVKRANVIAWLRRK